MEEAVAVPLIYSQNALTPIFCSFGVMPSAEEPDSILDAASPDASFNLSFSLSAIELFGSSTLASSA